MKYFQFLIFIIETNWMLDSSLILYGKGSTNQFCSQTERYFGILLVKNWRKSRKRLFNSSFLIWDSFIPCPTLVRGRNHADLPFVFKNYQNIDHDRLVEDGTGHLSLLNMKLAGCHFISMKSIKFYISLSFFNVICYFLCKPLVFGWLSSALSELAANAVNRVKIKQSKVLSVLSGLELHFNCFWKWEINETSVSSLTQLNEIVNAQETKHTSSVFY